MSVRRSVYYWLFGADRHLSRIPAGASFLDVGCCDGRGSEVLRRHEAFGIDIDRAALLTGTSNAPVLGDVRDLPYRDRAFDVVVALDVIEHLEKRDALVVLMEMERVARREVVVATPSGFLPTPPAPPDEPWHEHRCGFEPHELQELGYTVRGFGGPKQMRADGGWFRWGPLGQIIVASTDWYWARQPTKAFNILGVKRVNTTPHTIDARPTVNAGRLTQRHS